MTKKLIRLTESDLHNIIKESVKKVLKESYNDDNTHTSNYIGSIGNKEEIITLKSILDDLDEAGLLSFSDPYPTTWSPLDCEDVLKYAIEYGYDPEVVKECFINELTSDMEWLQKSIAAVKKWRFDD